MPFRRESPNSINTYKFCPRKYFYIYKLSLPTKESIATLIGKAVHKAIEQFFDLDPEKIDEHRFELEIQEYILTLFNRIWVSIIPELCKLKLNGEVVKDYYKDSTYMLQNFVEDFILQLKKELENPDLKTGSVNFVAAFAKIKPKAELHLASEVYNVQGYIDVLHGSNGNISIMDYKTSKKDNISEEYRLQLAIYALLYKENFNDVPNKVGLHFLRCGTKKFVNTNGNLLEFAKAECLLIQEKTKSNVMEDYPMKTSILCKWNGGECDFYPICFCGKGIQEYKEEVGKGKERLRWI